MQSQNTSNYISNLSLQMQHVSLDKAEHSIHRRNSLLERSNELCYEEASVRPTSTEPPLSMTQSQHGIIPRKLQQNQISSKGLLCPASPLSIMSVSGMEQMYDEETWRLYSRIQNSRQRKGNAEPTRDSFCSELRHYEVETSNDDYFFFDSCDMPSSAYLPEDEDSIHEEDDEGIFDLDM